MKFKVAPHIQALVPYPPGKPLEELEREYGITGSIKLASNENAWGPSPLAVTAIQQALGNLHRYPDGSCYYLAEALASKLGVRPEQIILGNGSNEIISLLISALLEPGQEVVTSQPTFLMYQKLVQVQAGINRVVPLRALRHDLDGILAQVNDNTRLVFLDNPNNPTGSMIEPVDLGAFLAAIPEHVVVVLDEAYIDFAMPEVRPDTRALLLGDKPVVTLRTFSKAYGLAGLRVGYGLMPAPLAGLLHRVRQPFNVNTLAQVGALAALEDTAHYEKTLEQTRQGMAWLAAEVEKLGCSALPSNTNFFLIDLHRDAGGVYESLLRKGVIIRPMAAYGYPEYIRITIGRRDENERFIKALAATLGENNG